MGIFNSGNISLYLNGVLENTLDTEYSNLYSSSVPVIIGAETDNLPFKVSTDNSMDGIIDDVRIYNRSLSESEIQTLYKEGSECEGKYTEVDIKKAKEEGRQACINDPSSCGIKVNEGCTQLELDAKYQEGCDACSNASGVTPTISPELNMHIPALQYQTLLGNINLWADFKFAGENNGDMLWKFSDFGEK